MSATVKLSQTGSLAAQQEQKLATEASWEEEEGAEHWREHSKLAAFEQKNALMLEELHKLRLLQAEDQKRIS